MNKDYDVIIIGSGIGGLVCACYLVNNGQRVLVLEQHHIPGGCCGSFVRGDYQFDTGVHFLGSLRRGVLRRILDELDIFQDMSFSSTDLTDQLFFPGNIKVRIFSSYPDIIQEFSNVFPDQKEAVEKFFTFVETASFSDLFLKLRRASFKDMLDDYFSDPRLKAVLSALMGNIGLTAGTAPAFIACVLLRQYVLDSGFYPLGGMQTFSDALCDYIQAHGGEIRFKTEVKDILSDANRVLGIVTRSGEDIRASAVVSNCDAHKTCDMLGLEAGRGFREVVQNLKASNAMFVTYLGARLNDDIDFGKMPSTWFFSSYDIDQYYGDLRGNIMAEDVPWIVISFPSAHNRRETQRTLALSAMMMAPFETQDFWADYREILAAKMTKKVADIFPDLDGRLEVRATATPHTFYRYTSNYQGAFAGWLSTAGKNAIKFSAETLGVDGLHLAGHWGLSRFLPSGGIPSVAFSGRSAAERVVDQAGIKWRYDKGASFRL